VLIIWYHHTETSEWPKVTEIQFHKYEHIVVKFMYEFFGCDYCILLTILLHYLLMMSTTVLEKCRGV